MGATTAGSCPWWPDCYFYSRPRMGATLHRGSAVKVVHISTHAPTWGATRLPPTMASPRMVFLLTPPREGATGLALLPSTEYDTFPLTPPHGGRRLSGRRSPTQPDFYSRPRVWGDTERCRNTSCCHYFYSRPRVGGDGLPRYRSVVRYSFLLTPRMGGDISA